MTGWGYQFPCDYDWWQIPFWWERIAAGHALCKQSKLPLAGGPFIVPEQRFRVNAWIDSH